jgi:hypothetical protein
MDDKVIKEFEENLKPILNDMVETSIQGIIDLKESNDPMIKENKDFFLDFLNEFKGLYKNDPDKSILMQELIEYFNNI